MRSNTDAALRENGASREKGREFTHSAHWGVFHARWNGDKLDIRPHRSDPAPSPMLRNLRDVLTHKARVRKPAIRKAWLDNGPGPQRRRFGDEFVEVSWDEAIRLLGDDLNRVVSTYGPQAIYGGSYGWASAGRFHHAQSQIHRFLNVALGGYVKSVNSYSAGASQVLLPRVIGTFEEMTRYNVTWDMIAEHTDVVVSFGGMAVRNSMVASGGVSRHVEPVAMRQAAARGAVFHMFSPLRDDLPEDLPVVWHRLKVGTDTAIILGMCHTLLVEDLHDKAFLGRYCVGFDKFADQLLGKTDGIVRDADWAARHSGIPAETIREIARSLVRGRSLITMAHALQRARFGEQPVWAALALASMVGQIGLPGGGYNYALGSLGHTGRPKVKVDVPSLPQGTNGVQDFIPVARIADMLLNPGAPYHYNGELRHYPDIKTVYWAGGNPFHHHQDLKRLQEAFARPETIVVHEHSWTATAKVADIVLPATMTLEREDLGASRADPLLVAMHQISQPVGQARDDYDIFSDLADHLGKREAFTEGRSTRDWLRLFYDDARRQLIDLGIEAPDFETFWEIGELELPLLPDDGGMFGRFRRDPEGHRLATPSGKIEIFSETIASFGYDDCPGMPDFFPCDEQPTAEYPLTVIANASATRLHSQLDYGEYSQSLKVKGREVMRINPVDAAARNISDGDIVRCFNHRGACLYAARVTEEVMPGVIHLPTGAWYDPLDDNAETPTCMHGNPNVLTRDIGTSKLAQGCTGQVSIAQCERYDGQLPPVAAFDPPRFVNA